MRKAMAALVLAALLPCLGTRAAAAQTGSIRVTLEEPDRGAVITLCRVGWQTEGGYRLEEVYGGGLVRREDALSPHLAVWLAQTPWDAGVSQGLDAEGCTVFSQLAQGLYLLVQTETSPGRDPMRPFLVCLPYEGRWHVQARTGALLSLSPSPQTGQSPAPFLGALGMVLTAVGLAVCVRKLRI